MNDMRLEQLLLSARPPAKEWSPLTQSIMEQIKRHTAVNRHLHATGKQSRKGLLSRLRALHGTSLLLAIITSIILLTGAAYAATRFLPDLIKVINKGVNGIGRIEYKASAFADCYNPGEIKADVFEVLPTAGFSDEDVEKTLRAKCELMGMDTFASDTWPTYGENREWRDGDTIYYTRPDILGTVVSVSKDSLVLQYDGGSEPTKTHATFDGQELRAFSHGQRIDVQSIQPGDFVFSIVRASETYNAPKPHTTQDGVSFATPSDSPKVRGVIAVVKMSLPKQYYTSMQQHVYEVKPCLGNPNERCTNGPIGPSIDVFPREGGEGARNPHARTDKGLEGREINGTITEITTKSLTIKASSGGLYTVQIDKSSIDTYNTAYAPGYDRLSRDPKAVRVAVGSWISVLYEQKTQESRTGIALPDIIRISLLTDIEVRGR